MKYCAAADVLLYVPQAQSLVTASSTALDAWITEAGGIIDAHLRSAFVVPLFGGVEADVEQYVKSAAARLAGGLFLRAKQSVKSQEPHAGAERLIEEAMAAITMLKSDLTMIDSPLRVDSGEVLDYDTLEVTIAESADGPVFGMGDERTWL